MLRLGSDSNFDFVPNMYILKSRTYVCSQHAPTLGKGQALCSKTAFFNLDAVSGQNAVAGQNAVTWHSVHHITQKTNPGKEP